MCAKYKFFCPPSPGAARGGGQNLNCKFKTVQLPLSFLQAKLEEKNSKLIVSCSSLFSFRFEKCYIS